MTTLSPRIINKIIFHISSFLSAQLRNGLHPRSLNALCTPTAHAVSLPAGAVSYALVQSKTPWGTLDGMLPCVA
jgi:hypothetical protein